MPIAASHGEWQIGAMRELPVPLSAQRDPESWELMRAWVAEQGLRISLNIGVYDGLGMREGEAWGMILADAARHVAAALSERFGQDQAEVLLELRQCFEAELDSPTSPARADYDA